MEFKANNMDATKTSNYKFGQDLSDAHSCIHCLQNNIQVPEHLKNKFDLGLMSGLENDEDKRGWFTKIIDKIKNGWKLEIGESANLVADMADRLSYLERDIKFALKEIPSGDNKEVFTPDNFKDVLGAKNIPQSLYFAGKTVNPKNIKDYMESLLSLDPSPIKLFNLIKIDFEERTLDAKGFVDIKSTTNSKLFKEAEKITNSNFLDSATIRKNLNKFKNVMSNPNFKVSDNLSMENKPEQIFIPLVVSGNEVACFIRDTMDFYVFLTYQPLAFNVNALDDQLEKIEGWTYNDYKEFTNDLYTFFPAMSKKIEDSFKGLKNLTAEKVLVDLQDAEDKEPFANAQYVLTQGYRDLLIVIYNSCAVLSRFHEKLYYLQKDHTKSK